MAAGSIEHILPRVADEALEFKKYLSLLLALGDRRAGAEVVRGRPFEVTIDPSTVCQLSCPYCEVGNGTIRRERGFLDPALHERMLDELGPGVFIAWYFSTGEPLLNKRLPEIVAGARARGIFPLLSTNLSLKLADDRIDELLRCGFGVISVSLDGATPESYGRYRVGGDFSLVTGNLRRLVARKKALGLAYPLIEWRFLVFRHNQHEIEEVRRLAAEYGVDLLELWPGYAPAEAGDHEVQSAAGLAIERSPAGPALDAARRRQDSPLRARLGTPGGASGAPPAHLRYQKCDWLYLGTTLFPSGAVSPCCVSNNAPDDFGELTASTPFGDVWNGPRYREARRAFARGEPTSLVCSRCPNRDAQDYQFVTTLRAVLLNAPEWALAILAQAPDRFFLELDFAFSPRELGALRGGGFGDRRTLAAAARRLEREAAGSVAKEQILGLRELLVASRGTSGGGWYERVRRALRGERRPSAK